MKNKTVADNQNTVIEYNLVRSRRKTIAIEINNDGQVIVKAPNRTPVYAIEEVILQQFKWIMDHQKTALQKKKEREKLLNKLGRLTEDDMRQLSEQMLREFPPRVREYADILNVTYGRITIRNQRTRWGSCSAKGNLNFNCLLMQMPREIQDYVIVHELCHRKEMNHSKVFWEWVESVLPDYRIRRQWLKEQGEQILLRAFG